MKHLAVVIIAGCFLASSSAASQGSADQQTVLSALDRYERTATTGSLTFSSVGALTSALDAVVPQWVDHVAETERGRRQNMAALFVLDLSWADLRGPAPWGRDRAAMIEWACQFLRRAPPSEFARIWMLVSMALLQPAGAGFGDVPPFEHDHLGHARRLFPDDGRLRLAELLERPAAVNLSNRPGASAFRLSRSGAGRVSLPGQMNVSSYTLDVTLKDLKPLLDDEVVGAEAQAHVGIIEFHQNRLPLSIEDLTTAAKRASDPFVQNLAWLFAGLAYDAQGREADATAAYERAVVAIPRAKSSAMALASHWFTAGRREDASVLLDRAFDTALPTLDPWQNVGDMTRFVPGWMARLHAAVGHPERPIESAAAVTFENLADARARGGVTPRFADWRSESQALPVFRSTGTAVLIDVSVRSRNNPVEHLGPDDFEVLDNGVLQTVDTVDTESLPIDLTMVVDYYDATGEEEFNPAGPSYMDGQRDALRIDVPNIARLLRVNDRIRIIHVENAPVEALSLQAAGAELPQPPKSRIGHLSFRRNSAIYDAVALALMRATPTGRRHLVLTFTEGADDASILTKDRVLAVAGKADAVMHLSKRVFNRNGYPTILWPADPRALQQFTSATGGTLINSLGGSKYQDIQQIIDRLRQSYVLRYQPAGVDPKGWHQIVVRLKQPGKFDIEARKGYWGG